MVYLENKIFGRLTVKERLERSPHGWSYWSCECSCGNTVKVAHGNIANGHTKSCGCLLKENPSRKTHGLSKTPEYKSWAKIKERVFSKNCLDYKDYGAAGVTMQADWADSFELFYKHIGAKPADSKQVRYTVDRISNSRGYEEGNVRWATDASQARNKTFQRNNTSGVTGVLWDNKQSNTSSTALYAKAVWDDLDCRQRSKVLSVKRFGLLPAFAMAVQHRRHMIQQLNNAGAGYTPDHGL